MFNELCSKVVFFLVVIFLATGCANRMTATWDPSADPTDIKSFYVVKLGSDERGINKLIANKLMAMGYQATTGLGVDIAPDVDVVVDYKDKWIWDIFMYMIELTITFLEPKTDIPLASGNFFFNASLNRKSPQEMVDKVLTNIFMAGDPDIVSKQPPVDYNAKDWVQPRGPSN